jgi:hypothetical protein
MPTRKFALEQGGAKRVEISWRWFWKDVEVRLDGYVLGTIADKKELQEGRQFTLPDGSALGVQLVRKFRSVQLQVTRNGYPLPGSDSEPNKRLGVAYGTIFFIAGLNIVLGLIATLAENTFLTTDLGLDRTTVAFGVVFLILGLLVRRRSAVALAFAIALFIASTIWSFYVMSWLMPSRTPPAGPGIIVRILFLASMTQGFSAIRELNENEQRYMAQRW